jgi:hypothetical protein
MIDSRKWEARSDEQHRYRKCKAAKTAAEQKERPYLAFHGASAVPCPPRQGAKPMRTVTHSYTLAPLSIQRSR